MIQDELDRMSRYVDDLLLLAKAPRPDFLRLGPIDLDLFTHDLFTKARSLGDRDWRIDGTGVGIVVADPQRITQAVMNLADNAVRHTRAGDSISLGSSLIGDQARLWVRDEGPGIDPDDRERIFEPLRARQPELRLLRRRRAGPLDRARDRRGARRPRRAGLEAGARLDVHDRAPRDPGAVSRILIAEDEARLASFLEKGLRASGFMTTVVGDGPSVERGRERRRLRPAHPRPRPARQGRPRRPARSAQRRPAPAGDRAHGPRRPLRPGRGPRGGRRRLPAEALSLRGAGRAHPGPAARRAGRRRADPASRRRRQPRPAHPLGERQRRDGSSSARASSSSCAPSSSTPTRC